MLLIFGGLPATGKSTISREVARELGAVYLRVDTIEQGLRDVGIGEVGPMGYILGYKLASDNLDLGLIVVAESVNPLSITRDAWRNVGEAAGVQVIEIETVCTDRSEHKKRVDTRIVNIEGLKLPSWEDVQQREYEEWHRDRTLIDTAGESSEQSITRTLALIQAQRQR